MIQGMGVQTKFDDKPNYAKGTCPTADGLFERSILLAVPSCLTEGDEDDIIHVFRKVLAS